MRQEKMMEENRAESEWKMLELSLRSVLTYSLALSKPSLSPGAQFAYLKNEQRT